MKNKRRDKNKDIKDSFASSLVLTPEITLERMRLGYEDGLNAFDDLGRVIL